MHTCPEILFYKIDPYIGQIENRVKDLCKGLGSKPVVSYFEDLYEIDVLVKEHAH